jgi:hypothetical protein
MAKEGGSRGPLPERACRWADLVFAAAWPGLWPPTSAAWPARVRKLKGDVGSLLPAVDAG